MEYIVYFDNKNQATDCCDGQVYLDFLEYAFSVTDYFMLVYVNYYGKGYTRVMKDFDKRLRPFKIKRRTNPSWPGTLDTYAVNTTYKIVFYRTCDESRKILQAVEKLSDWSAPLYPQDLAFFQGNKCWFYSVGHEKIGGIIRATPQDVEFLNNNKLATWADARKRTEEDDEYFCQYDEQLE